ncbi:sulfurtransferase [Bacillus piscicola]|uniref:sulfurtransferase n=1 Tax=Bacillus piscicola TaxID=1632684 RepID=UPI001F08FF6E|nr:sulfurtransferase [Bacillus piscicola]
MSNIVTAQWLEEHLGNDENIRIADCSFYLNDSQRGRQEYEEAHIPGAVYVDLEKDLSGEKDTYGGRHPLPDIDVFAEKLGKSGIDQHTKVVAYDNQGGMMAARFWWMLRYVGHEDVYVLDRPFSHWRKEDRPVATDIPSIEEKRFDVDIVPNLKAPLEEVKLALHEDSVALIDARDYERFAGKSERIDRKAGHIPGASHYFWKHVLDEEGRWKSQSSLQEHFRPLLDEKEVISYCGSGVTACVNILGLQEAGYDNARLYVGSWSDWSSYDDLPVEKEE